MTRFFLAPLVLSLYWVSLTLHAQSVPKLLEETASHYQSLDAYEFDGEMDIRLPETGSNASANVTLIFPKKGSLPANSTLNAETTRYGQIQVRVGPGEEKPFPKFGYPAVGRFNEITKMMLSAEKIGSETLQLNGQPVACEVWTVQYSTTDEHIHDTPITYWIDPSRHLILRESTVKAVSPQIPNAVFTTTFHTAKFGVPTPQSILDWAAELASKGDVTERKDWIGRPAPDFDLRSVSGQSVKLSSLRGRIVILDFWAIACAPCRAELPIIEGLASEYRNRGVDVFGVSSWDDAEKQRAWLAKNNHTLNSLVDSGAAVLDLYKVGDIPSLVLIRPDGTIGHYWEGPASKDTLKSAVAKTF
jgi:peroxiredoxin